MSYLAIDVQRPVNRYCYPKAIFTCNQYYYHLDALRVIFSSVSFLETDALQGFKQSIPHPAFGITDFNVVKTFYRASSLSYFLDWLSITFFYTHVIHSPKKSFPSAPTTWLHKVKCDLDKGQGNAH